MQTSEAPTHEEIAEAIQRLVQSLAEAHSGTENLVVIGIARGGIELGKRIANGLSKTLDREIPYGVVDISFHRDDLSSNPVPHIQSVDNLPFFVEDKQVILVDDVIFSGRTIRAALNEIFDQGRPEKVALAVLVDRGGRSLPIQPDYVGLKLNVSAGLRVEVLVSDQADGKHSISIEP